jgi:hypothetical protein
MLATDVAGVQLQAYWNNATGASGASSVLVDSDNQGSAVTISWASSGEWGSGTGDLSPKQRMLNGLIHANPAASITLSNVPAGEHDVIVYTVGIPLQFQDQDYTIVGQTTRSIYTRQMNADQYNPNPIFVRGNSGDPALRTLANYVRFQQIQPAADGTIALNWRTDTTGFDRGVAVNAIQLLLNAPDIAEPPQLVALPQPTETLEGSTVVLNVGATGEGLSYQWSKDGANLSDGGNISGATAADLRISNFGPANEGFYSVAVSNEGGSLITDAVKVKIVAADRTIAGSLIVHFKLDETSGATAANTGTDAINGTAFAAPVWSAGKIGGAYTELSAPNGISVPNYTKIQGEVTVSAWIKLDPSLSSTDYQIVRSASGGLSATAAPLGQYEFDLDYISGTTMNLRVRIAAGPNIISVRETTAFPLDTWQHVAFTADGGQVRLYRNGQLVGSNAYLDPINQPTFPWFSIGARFVETAGVIDLDPGNPPDAGDQTLYGAIDDLGIWLFAWPASVIQSINDQGNAGADLTTAELPVLPPPPTDITLSVGLVGGNVQISWAPATGTLETTTNVGDPNSWTEVTGASNPYSTPPTGNAYFRVRE